MVPVELQRHFGAIEVGEEFDIHVQVEANATTPVDAVQVYLDFDPAALEVVSIRASLQLERPLQSTWDNERGQVAFASGTLNAAAAHSFLLCFVRFRAKEPPYTGNTLIQFEDLRPPHQTKVIYRGLDITGKLQPVLVWFR